MDGRASPVSWWSWATGAAIAAYLVAYLIIAAGPDGSGPAWWYVVVLAVAAVLACLAAMARRPRAFMVPCLVLVLLCLLAGLLSVGLLLAPALATSILSVLRTRPPGPPPAVERRG